MSTAVDPTQLTPFMTPVSHAVRCARTNRSTRGFGQNCLVVTDDVLRDTAEGPCGESANSDGESQLEPPRVCRRQGDARSRPTRPSA